MNNDRRGFVGSLICAIGALIANVFGLFTKKSDPTIAEYSAEKMKEPKLAEGRLPDWNEGRAFPLSMIDTWAKVISDYHAAGGFGELCGGATAMPMALLPNNTYFPLRPMFEPELVDPDLDGLVTLVQQSDPWLAQFVLATIVRKLADPLLGGWPVLTRDQFDDRTRAGLALRAADKDGKTIPIEPHMPERVTSLRFVVDLEEVKNFNAWSLGKALVSVAHTMVNITHGRLTNFPKERCEIYRTNIQLWFKREAYMLEFFAWFNQMGTYYESDKAYEALLARRRLGHAHPAVS